MNKPNYGNMYAKHGHDHDLVYSKHTHNHDNDYWEERLKNKYASREQIKELIELGVIQNIL